MKTNKKEESKNILSGLSNLFNLERLFRQKPKNDKTYVLLTEDGTLWVNKATEILTDTKQKSYTLKINLIEYRRLIDNLWSLTNDR